MPWLSTVAGDRSASAKALRDFEQEALAEERFVDGRESLFLAAGEVQQDVLHVGREPGEVGGEVRAHVVGKFQQIDERILGGVVERLARSLLEQRVAGLFRRRLVFLGGLANGLAGRLKHAIETTQERERQDHVLVILGLVVVLDEVGNLPEELGDFGMVLHER